MKRLLKEIAEYSIKQKPGDNPLVMEKLFCFDRDFIGFSGHFPGYPILPAVLQLLLAQLCIEEQKGCKISITSIEKAKFLSEIRPDETISIQCADADTGDSQRMKVKIMSKDKVLSIFNLYFHPEKEIDSV
jgi:3-hydroxyacyl-[acyl-carrier-protein] dehydratase